MSDTQEQIKFGLIGIIVLAALIAWIGSGDSKTKTPSFNNQPQQKQQKINKSVDIKNLEILGNNLGFFIDGKAAQSVHFGIKSDFECEAIWQFDELNPQVAKALVKKDKRNSNKTTSIDCNTGGQYFVQSSKHDTIFELLIIDNKPKEKTAKFVVKFKLLNMTSNNPEYLTMNYAQIDIIPETYELIF